MNRPLRWSLFLQDQELTAIDLYLQPAPIKSTWNYSAPILSRFITLHIRENACSAVRPGDSTDRPCQIMLPGQNIQAGEHLYSNQIYIKFLQNQTKTICESPCFLLLQWVEEIF